MMFCVGEGYVCGFGLARSNGVGGFAIRAFLRFGCVCVFFFVCYVLFLFG